MNAILKKDGIKGAISSTRVMLKAIEEDLVVLREYVEEAGALAAKYRMHIPSEHYPAIYLAKFEDVSSRSVFIRLQEDAPFICTGIALLTNYTADNSETIPAFQRLDGLRLSDESNGRAISHQPLSEFIPMGVFKTQIDPALFYLGQNFYYELPAEVSFPKNGIVKAEIASRTDETFDLYVALIGYKIFGG